MLRSDSILEQEVAAELASDIACRAERIGIAVKGGIVTLSGAVADPYLRAAAVRAVKRVFGVEGVDPQFDTRGTSTALASASE